MKWLAVIAIGLLVLIACNSSTTPQGRARLSVTKTGEGTVTSTPAGIDCGATCQTEFERGTVVLTATPAPQSWTGCDNQTETMCTVNLTGNRTVTVAFAGDPNPNPDPDPDPDPDPTPEGCSVVISSDITIPMRLVPTERACDYLFVDDIWVRSRLLIDPGVVIEFDQDARLNITDAGSITAVGTPEARITMRGRLNVQGYWYGLCFGNNRESRLEHVDLLWGGKVWSGGSSVCRAAIGGVNSGEPVHIKHSLIAGALTSGLDATSVPLGEFANNIFAANAEYGVRVDPIELHKLDVASDYLGTSINAPNGKPYIFISGLATFNLIDDEVVVWRNLNADYYLEDDFPYGRNIIVKGGNIQIEPGTRFVAGSRDSSINFWDDAYLTAVGTPEAPIIFTSLRETAGSWQGLSFADSGGVLEHVEVRYGGEGVIYQGNIVVYGDPRFYTDIRNSVISDSSDCGIADESRGESAIRQSGNTFSNNRWDLCGFDE